MVLNSVSTFKTEKQTTLQKAIDAVETFLETLDETDPINHIQFQLVDKGKYFNGIVIHGIPPVIFEDKSRFASSNITAGNNPRTTNINIPNGQTWRIKKLNGGSDDPTNVSSVDLIVDPTGSADTLGRVYISGSSEEITVNALITGPETIQILRTAGGTPQMVVGGMIAERIA